MKTKVLQIRIDEPFINQLEYLKKVNGYSSNSETVRKIIEKECRKESNVIRCRECKYSKPWYRDKRLCFLWDKDGIDVFEDGYCNYSDPTWKESAINDSLKPTADEKTYDSNDQMSVKPKNSNTQMR